VESIQSRAADRGGPRPCSAYIRFQGLGFTDRVLGSGRAGISALLNRIMGNFLYRH
jgi:hypothetical protein